VAPSYRYKHFRKDLPNGGPCCDRRGYVGRGRAVLVSRTRPVPAEQMGLAELAFYAGSEASCPFYQVTKVRAPF
jgi:hypothetical protein